MTPLLRRAFGNAAGNRVARLQEFYEIATQKKLLRSRTIYTKRGREMNARTVICRHPRVIGGKAAFVSLCDTVRALAVLVDKASVR